MVAQDHVDDRHGNTVSSNHMLLLVVEVTDVWREVVPELPHLQVRYWGGWAASYSEEVS